MQIEGCGRPLEEVPSILLIPLSEKSIRDRGKGSLDQAPGYGVFNTRLVGILQGNS